MAIMKYQAKVADVEDPNEKFRILRLELIEPSRVEFQAGQYVILFVPGHEEKRNYSIMSSPAIDHRVELLIDLSPQGIATSYLGGLKPGDLVEFMAPGGMFVMKEEDLAQEQSLVFVATGSGITPIWSMIQDLLQVRGDTRPMQLYWGLRHEKDMMLLTELEDIQKQFSNIIVHFSLSDPTPEWPLCSGRVTDCLRSHDLPDSAGYYLCGNQHMLTDVQSVLESRGVSPERIHHEKFY